MKFETMKKYIDDFSMEKDPNKQQCILKKLIDEQSQSCETSETMSAISELQSYVQENFKEGEASGKNAYLLAIFDPDLPEDDLHPLMLKSAEKGFALAKAGCATYYINEGEYDEAKKYLDPLEDIALALYIRADMYKDGAGEKDGKPNYTLAKRLYEKANSLFEKAATANNPYKKDIKQNIDMCAANIIKIFKSKLHPKISLTEDPKTPQGPNQ